MASPTTGARLGYVICYVPDVHKSVQFYENAFGLKLRFEDKSRKWAEFETGPTTLAFTPVEQLEAVRRGSTESPNARHNVEIEIDVDDVYATYKHAVSIGAQDVAAPEQKPWGQAAGYIRDPDGNIIRLGSHVDASKMK